MGFWGFGVNLKEISEKNKKEFKNQAEILEKDIKKRQNKLKLFLGDRKYNDINEFEKTVFDSQSKAILTLNTKLMELKQKLSTDSLSKNYLETSKWKRGDNLTKRPHSIKEFESNYLDRFRATFYHEIGHHVHQTYKKRVTMAYERRTPEQKALFGEPEFLDTIRPLEDRLDKVKDINLHSPSNYGATNTAEWFVENFSLYYRGKEELVAPEFIKILQEIKNDKIP